MSKPLPAKGYCVAEFVVEASTYLPGLRFLRGPAGQRGALVQAYATPNGDVRFTRWMWANINGDEYHQLIELLAYGDQLGRVKVRMWPSAFPKVYGLGKYAARAATEVTS